VLLNYIECLDAFDVCNTQYGKTRYSRKRGRYSVVYRHYLLKIKQNTKW